MKKISLIICLLAVANFSIAQKQNVHSAWNYLKYEQYDKAKEAIDGAITDESSNTWWKTWYYRGLIYQDIHQQKKEEALNAKNALQTACEAYKKSLEIDPKHDEVDDVLKVKLPQIMQEYNDSAMAQYKRSDYTNAFQNFKSRLDVYSVIAKYVKLPADTGAIFNAAIMADKAGKTSEAITYFQQAADLNYTDAYSPLSRVYCKAKDTAKAITTMETGLSHSKGDVNMLKDYINLLYQNRNYSKAVEKINEAIKLEPNNEVLYVFLGQIYEQTNKPTEAEEQYKKALQLNPNNYEVVKIIGINLYNQAVKINKDANEIPAEKQAEYDAMIKKRNEVLEKAFPYLEKAKQIKPDDEETTRPYEKTKSLLKK